MDYRLPLLYFLLFILLSCQSKSADLEKFESILGPEKSEVLTELTEDFESEYLLKKYPNTDLSESYLKFMEDMAKGNLPKRDDVISAKNEKLYKESGLINEKYLYPDSVWIQEDGIRTRWAYKNEMGLTESYENFRPVNSKDLAVRDSILELEKSIVNFNTYGNYIKALEAIKDESPFIDLYHTYVTNVGMVGSSILYPQIRDNKLDVSGPVERRVLVLHLIY